MMKLSSIPLRPATFPSLSVRNKLTLVRTTSELVQGRTRMVMRAELA